MSLTETTVENPSRKDFVLEEAFLQATNNTITVPNTLQRALFPRLSSQDTGLIVTTGPGAGRFEAVVAPILTGTRNDEQLHRLIVIAPDHCVLDDYVYRLIPYIRSLASALSKPLTFYVDQAEPFCRRYAGDGSFVENKCNHPLDINIDIVVAHFSNFRTLFFGVGGVHALPAKLEVSDVEEERHDIRRRDLFYFDEAQGYAKDEFTGFMKLIEFLYAEDLDILIGSTTLPDSCIEALSFLEVLTVEDAQRQPPRTIKFLNAQTDHICEVMVEQVRTRYFESSRLGIVRENPGEAVECFNILQPLYPQGVYLYHSGQRAEERMRIYSQLRELEKEGEGYLLIADGAAVEAADLDVNMMITSTCSPEQLIRRAGRCNRRADLVSGEMIVVGTQYVGRELPESRAGAYLDKLKSFTSASSFNVDDWKMFIV